MITRIGGGAFYWGGYEVGSYKLTVPPEFMKQD